MGHVLAGGRARLAVEWDDHAAAVYRLNFPTTPIFHGDVAKLSVDEALRMGELEPGELDILDGSPPCQGFSTVGKRQLEDRRNGLFAEYVRLLRGLQPRAFVMENVSGMVKGKMRLVFVEALRALRASGYKVKCRLMNAAYFGVPQDRQRVFFVGVREDIGMEPSHPRGQTRPITLREALGEDMDAVREGFGPTNLVGVRSADFANKWRSAARPCCTIVKSRPPILLLRGGRQREMTAEECAIVGSFPTSFKWIGAPAKRIERIGNSVPPMMMKALSLHILETVLQPLRNAASARRASSETVMPSATALRSSAASSAGLTRTEGSESP